MAQLLPFTESMPLDLTAVQLIYQTGGYWVYRMTGWERSLHLPAQPRRMPRLPAPGLPPASE